MRGRRQGHAAYRDRLAQLRLLRLGLADARRELHLLRTGVANVDVLRREARPCPPAVAPI
jgi:hypothetical protein